MFVISSDSQKCSYSLINIVFECFTILRSTHDHYHLLGEFEIGWFKLHIPSRWYIKYESKVNMNQIPFVRYQYIPIMSILNLQYVWNNAVCSLTFYEILPSHLKAQSIFLPKFRDKILIQITPVSFTHLISWDCIWYNFYNSTNIQFYSSSIRNTLIGKYKKV